MISIEEVIKIHNILIEKYGGSKGLRDKGLLDSSINRIYQVFDSTQLYPTPIDKAAAILESVIKNHPFIDGNKRIGYVLMRLILMEDELDIECSPEDKYEFVMNIAKGDLNFETIKKWIMEKTIKLY